MVDVCIPRSEDEKQKIKEAWAVWRTYYKDDLSPLDGGPCVASSGINVVELLILLAIGLVAIVALPLSGNKSVLYILYVVILFLIDMITMRTQSRRQAKEQKKFEEAQARFIKEQPEAYAILLMVHD